MPATPRQRPSSQPRRAGPGRPRKLTHERIVEAAIAVMEKEGFAALTTRSLARELGTTGSTLYNYVERIEDIEVEALRVMSAEITPPTAKTGPALRAEFLEHLLSARRLFLKHPRVSFPEVGSPSWHLLAEINAQWYEALARYTARPHQAVLAYTALMSTTFASAERERFSKSPKALHRHKRVASLLAEVKLDTPEDLLTLMLDQLLPGLSRS
ncbi:MAG TPA: TetR/AcrR family transcriptional regulator [Nevskiaceae bacterium]|nr:TetR/AcrR family transcriptional regulator [Nevskiaceae bacterium]